jgi:hypothetical protein
MNAIGEQNVVEDTKAKSANNKVAGWRIHCSMAGTMEEE